MDKRVNIFSFTVIEKPAFSQLQILRNQKQESKIDHFHSVMRNRIKHFLIYS